MSPLPPHRNSVIVLPIFWVALGSSNRSRSTPLAGAMPSTAMPNCSPSRKPLVTTVPHSSPCSSLSPLSSVPNLMPGSGSPAELPSGLAKSTETGSPQRAKAALEIFPSGYDEKQTRSAGCTTTGTLARVSDVSRGPSQRGRADTSSRAYPPGPDVHM